jgi:hypothetical protein
VTKTVPLFQKNPVFRKQSQFRPKGWTETVEGYLAEARQLARTLIDNRRLMGRSYSWHLTINVEVVQTATQITDLWVKACRNMRLKGLVALWVREPTCSGKVHYHLVVKSRIGQRALRGIIRDSMPDLGVKAPSGRRRLGWHMKLQPVTDDWQLVHYVSKAKIAGCVKGVKVDDYYKNKRLLFSSNLKLKKYGTIGDFWERPKAALWQDVKDKEARIADGLKNPDVRRLARHVHDLLGGYVPLKDIERNYGYNADDPMIRDWIKRAFYPDKNDAESPIETL